MELSSARFARHRRFDRRRRARRVCPDVLGRGADSVRRSLRTQDRNFALSEACARAILSVDAELALPHWLVERFSNTERGLTGAGMARRGANPAALLRVYLAFEPRKKRAAGAQGTHPVVETFRHRSHRARRVLVSDEHDPRGSRQVRERRLVATLGANRCGRHRTAAISSPRRTRRCSRKCPRERRVRTDKRTHVVA